MKPEAEVLPVLHHLVVPVPTLMATVGLKKKALQEILQSPFLEVNQTSPFPGTKPH